MRVCYFGIYDRGYARSKIMLSGLHLHDVEVIECHVDPRQHSGIKKYVALYQEYKKIRHTHFDFVIVAFPGHTIMWFARVMFRVPIVFDAFVSLFDSNVYDREAYSVLSPRAWKDWLTDYMSMHLADRILLDTNAHIQYCAKTFYVRKDKFIRVLIGADSALFSPQDVKLAKVCTVHFHGTFIPLQGVRYIVEAAKRLQDEPIRIVLWGNGQEYASIAKQIEEMKLSNIELSGMSPIAQLPGHIASAHFCLGIFGNTPKTGRVIPNKVYEYMAMGKAVITADTPAIKELEEFGSLPLYLVRKADAQALADAIRKLAHDPTLRQKLGDESRKLFYEHLEPKDIVADMLAMLPSSIVKR